MKAAQWKELVACAITGTTQMPPPQPDGFPDPKDTEGAALTAAALASISLRAGFKGVQALTPVIEPAPEDLSRDFIDGEKTLRQCLQLGKLMVYEWLVQAEQHGLLVPRAVLPELFAWHETHRGWTREIRAVIGDRGRWLARLRPEWEVFQAPPVDVLDIDACRNIWLDEAPHRFLFKMAEFHPYLAKRLLKETWEGEKGSSKEENLPLFKIDPQPEDVPFLFEVLSMRKISLRRLACEILMLHASDFAFSAESLGMSLLKVSKGLLGNKVEARLPDLPPAGAKVEDAAGEAERILIAIADPKEKAPRQDLLERLIGLVQPVRWEEMSGLKPEQIVAAVQKHEYGAELIKGMERAAFLYQDVRWAEALLERLDYAKGGEQPRSDLLDVIPEERRLGFLRERLEKQPRSVGFRLMALGRRWDRSFSSFILDQIVGETASEDKFFLYRQQDVGYSFDLTILPQLEAARHLDPKHLDKIIEIVSVRKEMLETMEKSSLK